MSLSEAAKQLDRLTLRIPAGVASRIDKASARLREISAAVPYIIANRIAKENQRLDNTAGRLPLLAASVTAGATHRLENLGNMVRLLSPQNTLLRGYTITRRDGKAVTSASALSSGDVIETLFADGSVKSSVQPDSDAT